MNDLQERIKFVNQGLTVLMVNSSIYHSHIRYEADSMLTQTFF
jgi:hypothetical protein